MHSVLVDDLRAGVSDSHRLLAAHDPLGDWVWCLDDDDECIDDDLVRLVHETAEAVDVIMVKMDHGAELGILPDSVVWGKGPVEGHLGISSYIVRDRIWRAHRHLWETRRYASDYDFIAHVFEAQPVVVWVDRVVSRTQDGRHMGAE